MPSRKNGANRWGASARWSLYPVRDCATIEVSIRRRRRVKSGSRKSARRHVESAVVLRRASVFCLYFCGQATGLQRHFKRFRFGQRIRPRLFKPRCYAKALLFQRPESDSGVNIELSEMQNMTTKRADITFIILATSRILRMLI